MNEPYILILLAIILSVGNFAIWWLLFDKDFSQRLGIYEEAFREQMKRENEKFVAEMQDKITVDSEALELTGFGVKWKEKIMTVSKLREDSSSLRRRTVWVYYFALGAILFASGGLVFNIGIVLSDSFTLYHTAVSWWILVVGVFVLVGLLVHYQLIENKLQPITEGEPIKNGSSVQSLIHLIRSKLPL